MDSSTAVRVRALWGEVLLDQKWVPVRGGDFVVGEGRGVDFSLSRRALPAPRFALVASGEDGPELRLLRGMRGRMRCGGTWQELPDADAVPLGEVDAAEVELGGLRFEVQRGRPPARVPLGELVGPESYLVLNVLLLLLLAGGLWVVSANSWSEDGWDDGMPLRAGQLEKIRIRAAELVTPPRTPSPVKELAPPSGSRRPERASAAAAGRSGAAPKHAASEVFDGGGIRALLSARGPVADVQAALDGMQRRTAVAGPGGNGLGFRDSGDGGGGLVRTGIGLVGLRSRGREGGPSGAALGLGMGSKEQVGPEISVGPPVMCGGRDPAECGLDRDLVRKVIDLNKGQIRYCYEMALQRAPALAGKVAVRFTIGEAGGVIRSEVPDSTVRNAELEQCVRSRVHSWKFPKPRGGGNVVVTYPFLFKPSGQ